MYEVGINEDLSAVLTPPERLELLWKCLKATRSMLEARLRERNTRWPKFICLCSYDFAYTMLVCLKLSTLSLPGWDLRLVRQELDFDKYLEKQIEELRCYIDRRNEHRNVEDGPEMTEGASGSIPFQDPFIRLHHNLTKLRVCVLAELVATMPVATGTLQSKNMNPVASEGTPRRDIPTDTDAVVAALFEGKLAESSNLVDGFDDPFWADMYKVSEWETNFGALLGWDPEDVASPSYTSWASGGTTG